MDFGYRLNSENPKKTANVLSKLFFVWMISIVRKGTNKCLDLKDLYRALDKDKSEALGDRLENNWNNECFKAREKKGKPSFLKAISKTFILEFMLYGILWFIQFVLIRSSQPLVLRRVIYLFSVPNDGQKTEEIYIYSGLLIVLVLLGIFCMHHTNYGLSAIGMRVRIASSSLIYRKITKLNQKSLGQTAAGQVVNLLSNDVNRFDTAVMPLHSLWVLPFQIAALTYIIWEQVGVSSLVGITAMALVGLPFQGYLARFSGKLRSRISKKTDRRVKLMSEVISGIQVIKMYAWEKPFEKIIKLARAEEISDITSTSYLRGVFASCMVFLDRMSLCLTIICFILLGNSISADIVFSLAQCFNLLQMGIAILYPMAISYGAEALISIKRLQEFLMLEEREETKIDVHQTKYVALNHINARWTDMKDTLEDVNLKIPAGTLCAIVGPVGAGKSSILQLLLGELPASSGTIQIGGDISFSSQEPWLFQSSVRKNILFGLPFDKTRYARVVRVCALEPDFEQFPHRDRTIVGERGVSLSGGQRARINLARAVYRHADIYLMDDPLSAVDTNVGKHLFEECISSFLRGKTRILVTHQLQYLKKSDLIIVINEGRIEAQGTFEELSKCNLDFTKLLKENEQATEKKEEVEENIFLSESRKASVLSIALSGRSGNFEILQDNQTEDEESGSDPNSKPFKDYILASKHFCLLILLNLLFIVAQALCVGADIWVAFWTSQEELRHFNTSKIIQSSEPSTIIEQFAVNSTNSLDYVKKYIYKTDNAEITSRGFDFNDIFDHIKVNSEEHTLIKTNYAMYFYAFFIGAAVVFTLTRSFVFYKMCMFSSINLHSKIFHTLLQAPMRFFDVNPSGRVLNRFSKDMGAVDELLPSVLLNAIQISLVMVGILVSISVSNPYAIIAISVLAMVFYKLRGWYVSTAKRIKHLEGIAKSPVFSHVSSTLNGIITIRSSQSEAILIDEFDEHQNVHTSAWFLIISCMYSFGLWIDLVCAIFIAIILFSFVLLHSLFGVSGSMVGLAISQSLVLTGMVQVGMRESAEVINQLTSVERVMQYTKTDMEGPFQTPKENVPNEPWPQKGLVVFKNLSLKYIEDDPPVLKNLDFTVLPGQKIGIVGRTGAGKSSLISALFRLAPTEGSIFIDGIDSKELGLTDLRRNISIIPQEPVLFSATLRYNLDPFDEFVDEEIWQALDQVGLKDAVESLEFIVSEGGSNFSLGQRQLVCLARAILRNNKILVLDEATANVDLRTDSFIQATIRKRFRDCTVFTIAHRLNSIMDSDKVLVMSFGNMVEFDHPHNLLQIEDGYFHKMVLETGPSMALQLKDIASWVYQNEQPNDKTE